MNSSEAGAPIRGTLLEQLLQLGGTTSKGSVVDAVRLSHALRPLDAMHSSRAAIPRKSGKETKEPPQAAEYTHSTLYPAPTCTGKKTPGGAGTHTGHTGTDGHTDHTDEPHNHPNPPTHPGPAHDHATAKTAAESTAARTAAGPEPTAPRGRLRRGRPQQTQPGILFRYVLHAYRRAFLDVLHR